MGSFSPLLISELSYEKSDYYNIRSSTGNMVDVPVWMVNDEWVYATSIDVSPALAGTDLEDPSVNVDPVTGDTSLVVNEIRLEDLDGIETLVYILTGSGHYEGDIFIPAEIAATLIEGIPSWLIPDINGNLVADLEIERIVRVSDLAVVQQTQTIDVNVLNIPILGSYAVGVITLEQAYSPAIEQYDFPLDVGNNWLMNYTENTIWSGNSPVFPLPPPPPPYLHEDKFEVTQQGDPNVPYGCTNSIRVQQINMTSGFEKGFNWYCEDARYFAWSHEEILLGMIQDLRLKDYNEQARPGNSFVLDWPFKAYPPGFDIDVEIYSTSAAPAFGEFRFETEGIEEDYTILPGSHADVSITVNNTYDDSDTTYDVGTHGLIAWDGYQGLGVKTLIIDPNAEGIDLVARSSGIVIERTRGSETIVLTSVTGFSAQRGDTLSLSFPIQNRGISPSLFTTLEINGPGGSNSFDIDSLDAYEEQRIVLDWDVPDDQSFGFVSFGFIADPNDLNDEVDESNNAGATPQIRIGASPVALSDIPLPVYTFENYTIDGSESNDPDGGEVSCEFGIETVDGAGNTWHQTRDSEDCILTYYWSDDGEYTVNMTVIDDEGDSTTIPIIAVILNQAPYINLVSDASEIYIGESFTINADDSGDIDTILPPDVAEVDIAWDHNGDGNYDSCEQGAFKFNCTLTPEIEGDVTITATVTDDDGATTTSAIIIIVRNVPPEITNIQAMSNNTNLSKDSRDFWIVNEDQLVNLRGLAFDSPNDIEDLSWTWSSINMGDNSVAWQIQDTGSISEIHVWWELSGEYTISSDVLDDDSIRSPEEVKWIKVNNVNPTAEITSTEHTVGESMPITLTGSASDTSSDIDSLIICWDVNPSENSDQNGSSDDDCDYEGNEMMHSWGSAGVYTVIYHAVDDDGARAKKQLDVEVTNQPARAIISSSTTSIYIGEQIFLDGSKSTDSPEDKENLAYLWDKDINVDSNGDGIKDNDIDYQGTNFTPEFLDEGNYIVQLTVKDEEGCEAGETRCITQITIEVKARPGGVIGSVVASIEDDYGIGLGVQVLMLILICTIPLLLFTRGRRVSVNDLSNKESWQEVELGMGYSASMPNAAPMTTQFDLQNNTQTTVEQPVTQNVQTGTTPPVPATGLPEGWTMEQWSYYGASWLAQQEENMNVTPQQPQITPVVESTPVVIQDELVDLLSLDTNKTTKSDPLSALEDDDLDF
jgi:hypothetical protein